MAMMIYNRRKAVSKDGQNNNDREDSGREIKAGT